MAVRNILTQSSAFASLAHTSGHANGVMVARGAMRESTSSSILLFLAVCVVDEQEIHDAAEDLYAPVLIRVTSALA
jgi:hypothetical protein